MSLLKNFFFKKKDTRVSGEELVIDPLCDILQKLSMQDYKSLSAPEFSHLTKLLRAINTTKIDLPALRDLAMLGIPLGCKGLRAILWRLILGYWPPDATQWHKHMEKSRTAYEEFKKEFLVKPSIVAAGDHPLSKATSSKWNNFFKDKQQTEEIMNDIRRTRPELPFVGDPALVGSKAQQKETHGDVMVRLLLIYTKLNPGICYVQGMNEILAMIYITIEEDTLLGYEDYVESDTFFAFSVMMGEIQNNFIRSLDKTMCGVKVQLDSVNEILKRCSFHVWLNLKNNGITGEFFALRWVLLLLSQEFTVPKTQYLWDAMLADKRRFLFLHYLIVAMLLNSEKELLDPEYSAVMKALQTAPQRITVEKLKKDAYELYRSDLEQS